MEENKNLWNKTTSELTVKDQMVVAAVGTVVTIGAMTVVPVLFNIGSVAKSKIQNTFTKKDKPSEQ